VQDVDMEQVCFNTMYGS